MLSVVFLKGIFSLKIRQNILDSLAAVEEQLRKSADSGKEFVSVTAYAHLTKTAPDGAVIWTEAFRQALRENEAVHIPAAKEPYWIDGTVVIPSNRTIVADPTAVIRLCKGVKVLMFRNEHPLDGTHEPQDITKPDCNISITGGYWDNYCEHVLGYGKHGLVCEDGSFAGVHTALLFNNIENLTLRNMTVAHSGGFSIQLGFVRNALVENITFEGCFADGVHVGGYSSNLVIRNIFGQVGDDLVAINAYDWINSSVSFGPVDHVLCEHLRPSEGGYRAMRILTGMYRYDDGSEIDCSICNMIVRDVKDTDVFKLYLQTPGYFIGSEPEWGEIGSGENLYFEDVNIDLRQPADQMEPYLNSDPVRGNFAAFEINANLKNLHFRNVSMTLHRDQFPLSWFATVGPKSVLSANGHETFDPYFSCQVDGIYFSNITVNGQAVSNLKNYIKEVRFEDVNKDGRSSGAGTVKNILPE